MDISILKELGFPESYISKVETVVKDPDLFFDDIDEFFRCAVRRYYNRLKN